MTKRHKHKKRLPARRKRFKRPAQYIADDFGPDSDTNFAFIAGYTEGGAPYGITWEEWEADHEQEITAAANRELLGLGAEELWIPE